MMICISIRNYSLPATPTHPSMNEKISRKLKIHFSSHGFKQSSLPDFRNVSVLNISFFDFKNVSVKIGGLIGRGRMI